MINLVNTVFGLLLVLGIGLPAHGQMACGAPKDVVERLRETYKETIKGYGIDNRGSHVQLFVSPNGNWTITIRPPKGNTCLSQWGTEWHIFGPALPEASHGVKENEE